MAGAELAGGDCPADDAPNGTLEAGLGTTLGVRLGTMPGVKDGTTPGVDEGMTPGMKDGVCTTTTFGVEADESRTGIGTIGMLV